VAWKPDYATPAELAAYVRVTDNFDQVPMQAAVTAASRAIDYYCKRQFGIASGLITRAFTPWFDRYKQRWTCDIEDLMTFVGLVISVDDGTGTYPYTVTDYELRPVNAPADSEPWTQVLLPTANLVGLDAEVQMLAHWGWTTIPDPVHSATLLQASRFLTRRDSPYGVAGSPPRRDSGSGMSVAAKELELLFYSLDPDVEASLRTFRKDWWIA
jgi:hypothetical protein